MKIPRIISVAFGLFIAVAQVQPIHAQGGPAFPGGAQPYVNPEAFRTDLLSMLEMLEQPAYGGDTTRRAGLRTQIAQLKQRVATLNSSQMAIMAGYYDATSFSGLTAELKAHNAKMSASQLRDATALASTTTDLDPVDYGICPPEKGSDAQYVKNLMTTLLTITAAATIVADTACSTIVEVLGEGTNLPFCVIDAVVKGVDLAANKVIDIDVTFCDGNIDSTRIGAALNNTVTIDKDLLAMGVNVNTLISAATQSQNATAQVQTSVTNLQTSVGTVQTSINKVSANIDTVQTSLDNLSAALQAGQALELRLRIEENLLQNGGNAIILFQLPAAQGGYLGLVRTIVVDSLAKVQAAGATTDAASSFLLAGDGALAKNQFKLAYQNYQKAYAAAASVLNGGELVGR